MLLTLDNQLEKHTRSLFQQRTSMAFPKWLFVGSIVICSLQTLSFHFSNNPYASSFIMFSNIPHLLIMTILIILCAASETCKHSAHAFTCRNFRYFRLLLMVLALLLPVPLFIHCGPSPVVMELFRNSLTMIGLYLLTTTVMDSKKQNERR